MGACATTLIYGALVVIVGCVVTLVVWFLAT
jgi:hypothetical protein